MGIHGLGTVQGTTDPHVFTEERRSLCSVSFPRERDVFSVLVYTDIRSANVLSDYPHSGCTICTCWLREVAFTQWDL